MREDDFKRLFSDFTRSREKYYTRRFGNAINEQIKDHFAGREVHQQPIYELLHALYWDAAGKYSKRMQIIFRKTTKASGQMGFIGEFAEAFKNFFEIHLRNLAQLITETTRMQIAQFIERKLKEGYNLNDVVSQIKELTDTSEMRARRIARTETTSAANAAGYFSAINAEYKMMKIWIATNDSRTRKTHGHEGVQGTKIPLEQSFRVGNYKLMYPGDKGGDGGSLHVGPEEVVNCRCTLGYEARRDERGRLILKD